MSVIIREQTHSMLRRSWSGWDSNEGQAISIQSPIETNRTPAGVGFGCDVRSCTIRFTSSSWNLTTTLHQNVWNVLTEKPHLIAAIPRSAQYNRKRADACTTTLSGICPSGDALKIFCNLFSSSSLSCCKALLEASPFFFWPVLMNRAIQFLNNHPIKPNKFSDKFKKPYCLVIP